MLTVYALCALGGSLMLLIFLVMTLMGFDGDGVDVDAIPDDLSHGVDDILAQDGAASRYELMDDAPSANSSFFFQILSFRSAVAAIAFFGLGGRVADAAGAGALLSLFCAVTSALAAMVLVAWIMQVLYSLKEDGTVRIVNTLGAPANVHLTIPEARAGVGKVVLTVQNRSMEYDAMTDEAALPTGSRVVVADIINDNTVLVKRA